MRYRIDIIRVTEGEEEIEVIFQMIKLMVFQTKVKNESESHSVVSNSLQPHGIYSPWNLQARILEWVAFPFSRESFQTRDQTRVSRIAGGFFIS